MRLEDSKRKMVSTMVEKFDYRVSFDAKNKAVSPYMTKKSLKEQPVKGTQSNGTTP